MEQAGKNTILMVRGTAAEPAALSAFTAAQPDVQLQTISGLDEAGAALERLRPTLIVLQSDAPDAQALHRCAELAETAEAVFLLLVRQEAYGAAWRTLQKHGVCVMTWPMEQAVLTQTLRNLLLLKKSMQTMQAQTDQLRSQLQDLKRIQKAKGLLMRQLGMTEQDAHRWIEKAAMDRCVKKREIAETIIRMYESENALTKTNLVVEGNYNKAFVCNLLEEEEAELELKDGVVCVQLKPYEVVTVKLV